MPTEKPRRVQLSRRKGWRMPPDTVNVARPSKWGNPFTTTGDWIVWAAVALGFKGDQDGRRRAAVALHRLWMTGVMPTVPPNPGASGAIGFANGVEVSTTDYIRGLASGFAGLYPPPELPARPALDELRGKHLACWCPLHLPCHADVLLELANQESDHA